MKLIKPSEIVSGDYIAMINGSIIDDIRHLRIFKAVNPLNVGSSDLCGFIRWNATVFRNMSSIDTMGFKVSDIGSTFIYAIAIRVYTNSGYVFKLSQEEIQIHITIPNL